MHGVSMNEAEFVANFPDQRVNGADESGPGPGERARLPQPPAVP